MKKSTQMILMGALFTTGLLLHSNAAVPSSITANVPGAMNYQGRLVDTTGTPYVNGTYTFDIRIYTVANGGTPIWGGTYSSYVKDGYFNIMLGGASGQSLSGTTYTHSELWKALWPDPANGNSGSSLYLGVTPWQGFNGATLSTKVELTPRQTLMTAPYAFRAQSADSAVRANNGFDVTGTITADDINIDGEMVRTSGTSVMIGGPDGNTSANYVNINAYGVDIDSGAQDIYLTSSDRIDVNASGYYDLDAGSVQVDATSGTLDLESQTSAAYLKGKTGVDLTSSGGAITLDPNTQVVGHDQLLWDNPGTTTVSSPIAIHRYAIEFGSGSTSKSYTTAFATDQYSVVVVGVQAGSSLVRTHYAWQTEFGKWAVTLTRDSSGSTTAATLYVDVMVISKHWVNDDRY